MPFKRAPQVFPSSIGKVTIGAGKNMITLGGENVLPLCSFDATIENPPKIGIQVSDLGPAGLPALSEFYTGCETVADWVARACETPGADFVCLSLEGADPGGLNKSIDDCVAVCKEAAEAATKPLFIEGSKNIDKDAQLMAKLAEALEGRNVLLLSAREENYKGIAVSAALAYGQKVSAESSVDINLAKQLNVLISQIGVKNESLVMNVGSAAAGYGFEYVASTMERIKSAALGQNDEFLQMPIITPVGNEAWSVKESVVSEEDFPEWGSVEERGISMEIATAAACIASGSNAVILKHPASVETISKLVSALM